MRPLRRVFRVLLWLLFTVGLVLFVGWLLLHWLILPHIDGWRDPIQARASRILGAPVRIGTIRAQSSGWVPALELTDVRVLDAEGRVALALPRVFAALSPRSVLALEPRFSQLLIDGASLDVRRDANGRLSVAGLDFGGAAGSSDDDDATAEWFFHQEEFVIRAGTLRWIDDMRQAPPLTLGDVALVVRNSLRRHEMRIDATPPPGWGERFSLRGRFTQPLFAKSSDWHRWSGSAYVDLPRADVRELRRHVSLPFELSEGNGALRGWFDVKEGEPAGATVDVALRAVALRLDRTVEPLEFERVQGRISGEKQGDRIAVNVRRFGFATGDGVRWHEADLDFAWHRDDAGNVTRGEFAAERLDVGVMAQIATRVPLGNALRDLLVGLHPQGVITGLATHWDGPLDAPLHYRVKGKLADLALVARPGERPDAVGRPGLSHASVQLDATEAGGSATVAIAAGVLDLPGIFVERELALDKLDAHVGWKIEKGRTAEAPSAVTVKVSDARFQNADARGQLTATWKSGRGSGFARGGRYPGELELDGRIADAKVLRTARYLPLGLPDGVRDYLGRAVRGGTLASASFRVRGDLADFPFHKARNDKEGEFRIALQVADLAFAYIPGDAGTAADAAWPALTAASGEVVIANGALEIKDAKLRLAGADWSRVHGRIAELGDNARLEIEGTGRGPLAEMLRFVNVTPVGRWTEQVLAKATATGPAELRLALGVPLGKPTATTLKASLQLAANDVRMTPDTPLLGATKGRVDMTEKGFAVIGGNAQVLGGELAFEGGSGTAADAVKRFTGQGTFSVEALRQASELGAVSRLATALTGQAAYRVALAFPRGRSQLEVTSNLVGVGVDLPQPIGKPAATPLALRVRSGPDAAPSNSAAAGSTMRDALQVELGNVFAAHFVREGEGDAARVVRGAIRVSEPRVTLPAKPGEVSPPAAAEPVALPASGVAASVALKRLDVPQWEAAAARLLGPSTGARATNATPAPPLVLDDAGGEGYVPDAIVLKVGELETGPRRLGNVTASLTQTGGLWRAKVDADELEGYLEYRPARRGGGGPSAGAGRIFARLSRLSLPKAEVDRVESLLDEPAASIPALDIIVDDFELRGRHLGRLEVEASNRPPVAGAGESSRQWQLAKLNLVMPEAQLSATGTWGATQAAVPRRATMNFHLALADSGLLLERLGMGKAVKGGKGALDGEVSWPGSPLSPDYARMSGQVKVAIDAGQFLKASPGAARLLGVLSLQSLPRRLLLDFRDLFEEGFAFDNVVGDVKIGQGLASTNNLRMRGVAAAVLMEGRADLERETQDLRVLVVPEINAGTASLAYAVINPAIGLGTFLAQYFLRKPLIAASTREFHVTGPWDDPKVERVERSLLGQAASEAPAGSGSAPLAPR